MKLTNSNIDNKIARASAVLIITSLAGHVLSLVKEIIVANYYGITAFMDAFYAAITIPSILNNVLLSMLASLFIPAFIECKQNDQKSANVMASIVINYTFIILLFIAFIIYFISPFIIRYGFKGLSVDSSIIAVRLLRIVIFSIILTGLIGIMTGILNSIENFFWPSFSKIFITLSSITFILIFYNKIGVFALVFGLLTGLLTQCIFLFTVNLKKKFKYYMNFNFKNIYIQKMISLSSIYFISMTVSQLNIVVDRIMASYLTVGSISALAYADKLIKVPLVIFAGSIATAVFPYFSGQVVANKISSLRDSLLKSIKMSGFIFIPMTVLFVVFSQSIIKIIFERGLFDMYATELTSVIFINYSFQIFFYACFVIFIRVLMAFKDKYMLLVVSVVGLLLNILFNYLFILFLKPAVAGIALSTSVVYFIMSISLLLIFKYKLELPIFSLAKYLFYVLLASLASVLPALYFYNLLISSYQNYTSFYQIFSLSTAIAFGLIIYIVISTFFSNSEMKKIYEILKKLWSSKIHGK